MTSLGKKKKKKSRITFEETFHLVESNILELTIQGWCIRSCLSIDQGDWESGVGARCRWLIQPFSLHSNNFPPPPSQWRWGGGGRRQWWETSQSLWSTACSGRFYAKICMRKSQQMLPSLSWLHRFAHGRIELNVSKWINNLDYSSLVMTMRIYYHPVFWEIQLSCKPVHCSACHFHSCDLFKFPLQLFQRENDLSYSSSIQSTLLLVNCPTKLSPSLLFGYLWWSSCWRWQPHVGWLLCHCPLLTTGMAV